MKKVLISLSLIFGFWIFDMGHRIDQVWLKVRMTTLKTELEKSKNNAEAILEIGSLIDSIDMNREDLVALLDERKSFQDYGSKLKAINNYILDSQMRMERLDEKVNLLNDQMGDFANIIPGLKKKLENRNQELERLRKQFIHFQEENDNLFRNVSLQEAALAKNQDHLELKDSELKSMEMKIQETEERKRIIEAEALYGLAHSIEEKAHRTHFAPDKKRQALTEALQLYRQSLELGNDEAKIKIEELENKMASNRK